MEARQLSAQEPPQPPPLREKRTGPKGRDDLYRPKVCPEGHVAGVNCRIRFDRVLKTGPFYTRVSYRCARREWDEKVSKFVEVRHRFTARSPEDPLVRRHPTHAHSYSGEACPTCEHTYATDEGPRAAARFWFAAAEIAAFLIDVGKGISVRQAIADARRMALRYRPRTKPHIGYPEPPAEVVEMMEAIAAIEERTGLWFDDSIRDTDAAGGGRARLVADPVPDEPSWLTEAPQISDADLLRAYTDELIAARKPRKRTPLPSREDMVGDERFLSKSACLGTEYIDLYGPTVLKPHQRDIWPDSIVLDSQPFRRRAVVETDEDARIASDFLFEVFAVQDGVARELMLLYPAGGKDQDSVREVLATKRGRPTWVVSDGDKGIEEALKPWVELGTIHYRCEDHLRKDALEFAARDGVRDAAVVAAIGRAQESPATWANLKAVVEAKAPDATQLTDWILRNEELALRQCRLRRRYPGRPRATGGIENQLGVVRKAFEIRKMSLRNRRRLAIVLELMRITMIHRARPEHFTLLVRRELERKGTQRARWSGNWDPAIRNQLGYVVGLSSSIIAHRDAARERAAFEREERGRAASAERHRQRLVQVAEASGETGVAAKGRAPSKGQRVEIDQGASVAEVPELMAQWHPEKNAGVDPSRIPAWSSTPVWWICHEHEAGDPKGRWPGHVHEWKQDPNHRAKAVGSCRFCSRRKACPGNSLRTERPLLALPDVWDYAKNDATGITPDNRTRGSKAKVGWLCAKHGPYEMTIYDRAMLGRICGDCQEAKRRGHAARKRREARSENARLADRYRARMDPLEPDDEISF